MSISNSEERALKAVKRGAAISDEMKQRLLEKGYIEEALGGLSLTTKGKIALSRARGMEM